MSRIGKKPIAIPAGVKVERSGDTFKVTGPKGALNVDCLTGIEVKIEEDGKQIVVSLRRDRRGGPCIRVSPHFYNTEDEILALLESI